MLGIKWKSLSGFATSLMVYTEMGSRLPHKPYTVQYLIYPGATKGGWQLLLEHKNLCTHIKTCIAGYHI